MRFLAALLAIMMLWPSVAQADELRPGYLELTEEGSGTWSLAWKLPVTTAPAERPLPPAIPQNCVFVAPPEIGTAARAIVGSAQLQCEGGLAGQSVSMPGMIGQSDMLVRIVPLDEEPQAQRLTAGAPSVKIAAQPGTLQVLKTYFVIGVEHILVGWDHLLFVIALVLLVQGWRRVVLAATAFTLSHSITLAAASLGFVGLPQRPVEALIALSILFLAVEIMRPEGETPTLTRRYPWVVAFLFGLLHGFGFAGALTSIGLPANDIAAALLAFNIGVEAGQLLVIAAVLALIALFRRFAIAALEPAVKLCTYAIGIIGAYWLVERTVL